MVEIVRTKTATRELVAKTRRSNRRIGVVPTMGALHDGHLSLVQAAKSATDFVVVTVFVNPTQFAPGEDFDKYPRVLQQDVDKLRPLGVDAVFAPVDGEMYSPGHSTIVLPPDVAKPLEGSHRQTHFQGVTTVVLKLFNITMPDVAFFGQKDYQQSLVIRRMVDDLDVPVRVEVCPTIRDSDGLAMSSRNAYLSDPEREAGLSLSRSLKLACERTIEGGENREEIETAMYAVLQGAGVDSIDYACIVDSDTLLPVDKPNEKSIALVAANVGKTRLIDNIMLNRSGLEQLASVK